VQRHLTQPPPCLARVTQAIQAKPSNHHPFGESLSGLRGKYVAQPCVPQTCFHLPTAHPVLKPFHAGSTSLSPGPLHSASQDITTRDGFPAVIGPGLSPQDSQPETRPLEHLPLLTCSAHKPHDMTKVWRRTASLLCQRRVQPLDETTARLASRRCFRGTWTPPDACLAVAGPNEPQRPPHARADSSGKGTGGPHLSPFCCSS
jgi:hypothetical protein